MFYNAKMPEKLPKIIKLLTCQDKFDIPFRGLIKNEV
jgi:hypothetical protein